MEKISISKLTKIFSIGKDNTESLFTSLLSCVSGKKYKKHTALKNITLKINQGEVVGIIGNNGAGKSTLIKIIAEIFSPTEGKIFLNGEVLFIGGVSKAFPPRLTVKEIIFLVGTMLGLSHKQIREKFDEIVRFAELQEYIGTQIYQLSRGMTHRLAFSVVVHCALHSKPDIVLLDEVFSKGGDIHFREKAQQKMKEFIESKATILFVSHNMETIKKYATRVLWLENGELIADGFVQEIVTRYENKRD